MGLTAIVSSAATSLSLFSPVGAGIGGVFVVAALVTLLGYLNILNVTDEVDERVQSMAYAVATPLAIAFAGIIVFQSLQAL